MLSKASKLESEFSCEAAAIADWASERSIVPKLNSTRRNLMPTFEYTVDEVSPTIAMERVSLVKSRSIDVMLEV
jgi:hypothetical protein